MVDYVTRSFIEEDKAVEAGRWPALEAIQRLTVPFPQFPQWRGIPAFGLGSSIGGGASAASASRAVAAAPQQQQQQRQLFPAIPALLRPQVAAAAVADRVTAGPGGQRKRGSSASASASGFNAT